MAEHERPNVLLITTDHWPASLLGCAGHPAVRTPTLDQLARNGVRFPNTYSECPVCVPARRTLMTSLKPHSHGMLANGATPMPDVPSLAQCFRDAGYHTSGVGKLHIHPQRQRLGFEEMLIDEEGRGYQGCRVDDYELYLADHGHPGARFESGMCNNNYMYRPWHLDEHLHVTNWAAKQMCRQLVRRDPTRPGFFYLSFSHPHPPLHPLRDYLEMYRDIEVPAPDVGDWAGGAPEERAMAIRHEQQNQRDMGRIFSAGEVRDIRRAFYALCTHIDHQIRNVIGVLRQEAMRDNTIICFTADHGDMLGNHHLWAKHWMYEDSACVPMIVSGTQSQREGGAVGHHKRDDRLVAWADVMPTLLELAGIEPPAHCEGRSMFRDPPHEHVYGAFGTHVAGNHAASRMIRTDRYKLIYYPVGNLFQLFDMHEDRRERHDLADDPSHAPSLEALKQRLIGELRGDERNWLKDGELVGHPSLPPPEPQPNPDFSGQRGPQMPPPVVGSPAW